MTREEVLEIIKNENLNKYSFFEPFCSEANVVGIENHDGRYLVYATDETGSRYGFSTEYDTESQAFKSFINRLRSANLLARVRMMEAAAAK